MKVVFFDRDGVLIKDPEDYRVESEDEIELFDDTISALKELSENGFSIVIITNQAGIEEGLLTESDFWRIHDEFLRRIEPSGIKVLRTAMNKEADTPHASSWRKPGPNMLLDVARDLNLDLSKIYMVGDNQSDIDASENAGCRGGVLVKTATSKDVTSSNAVFTAEDLTEAVNFITSDN